MYAVTVSKDNLPKGAEIQIQGLGLVKNGTPYQVTDEAADLFRQMNSTQESHFDKDGKLVTETVPGPTLLEAFKSDPTVKVETVKDPDAAPSKTPATAPSDNTNGGNS